MMLPDCAYKYRVTIPLHDTGFRFAEVAAEWAFNELIAVPPRLIFPRD